MLWSKVIDVVGVGLKGRPLGPGLRPGKEWRSIRRQLLACIRQPAGWLLQGWAQGPGGTGSHGYTRGSGSKLRAQRWAGRGGRGKKGLVPAVGGGCLTGGPLGTGGASLDG